MEIVTFIINPHYHKLNKFSLPIPRKFFTPYNYEFYNLVQRDFGWPEE